MKRTKPGTESVPLSQAQVEELTPREREVCSLVALGHTNQSIAERLEISPKTVETHRSSIMFKLGLRRRAEVVEFALKHGLIDGFELREFKRCAGCSVEWAMRGQFLSDPAVIFSGYQPAPARRFPGLLLFNHQVCGQRLGLTLESFQELVGEPVLANSCSATGNPAYCLNSHGGKPCPIRCVCAFVWRISQIIRNWPKNGATA